MCSSRAGRNRRLPWTAAWLLVAAMTAAADPATEARAHLSGCASCHGDDGQGIVAKDAPRIAGQLVDYLDAQLRAFRDGGRGAHAADGAGSRMSLMAAPLADPAVRRALAEQFAGLPRNSAPRTLDADTRLGATLYERCASCHGARGEGNAAVGGPRLAGVEDWYLLRQLRNYAAGLRGGAQADALAQQMAAQARVLGGEAELAAVVAYISGL